MLPVCIEQLKVVTPISAKHVSGTWVICLSDKLLNLYVKCLYDTCNFELKMTFCVFFFLLKSLLKLGWLLKSAELLFVCCVCWICVLTFSKWYQCKIHEEKTFQVIFLKPKCGKMTCVCSPGLLDIFFSGHLLVSGHVLGLQRSWWRKLTF